MKKETTPAERLSLDMQRMITIMERRVKRVTGEDCGFVVAISVPNTKDIWLKLRSGRRNNNTWDTVHPLVRAGRRQRLFRRKNLIGNWKG
jgi:hypothetical protein